MGICDKCVQIILKIGEKVKSGVHNLFKSTNLADC